MIEIEAARRKFLQKWPEPTPTKEMTICDFDIIGLLGKGTYGKVYYAKHKTTEEEVALKIQNKRTIVRKDCVANVIAEKHIHACMKFDFIVKLLHHFKDNLNVYLALEYLSGGDFFQLLKTKERLNEVEAQFYASNILLALEFLHSVDIVYRDLKPENILIDEKGYLKVSDFGFAKKCSNKTLSICGTPEYLAPEIVAMRPYGKSVDVWAFGILIYEMMYGRTPFLAAEYKELCYNICKQPIDFTAVPISEAGKDLLQNLLTKRASKRLGVRGQGISDIRIHEWFSSVKWDNVLQKSIEAPVVNTNVTIKDIGEQELNLFGGNEDHYACEFADF